MRIDLAYDGAAYVGWQMQPNGLSIQQVVEEALVTLLKSPERIVLNCAGRTDAGVHALRHPCVADIPGRIEDAALMRGLNTLLPDDIAVIAVATVAPDWNPRHDATRKSYRYLIHNSVVPDPFLHNRVWRIPHPLNEAAMREGGAFLVGQFDFTSFRAARCATKSSQRRILRLDVWRQGETVVIETTGTGYLKHMVRNIVGVLVEVGLGKRPPEWVGQVLAARDRQQAARCAPPQGLYMVGVDYDGPRYDEMDDE
ncbi:MAG: tRNA pseudouridine(38-40) synthase TruA [Nitrospinae bacterium]|nr:tRNA pseudouridine(38-40) synthase TruA [Nitrospinota bacterium]